MMNRGKYCIVLVIGTLTSLAASGQTDPPPMSAIRHEGLVDGRVGDVWKAFTTGEGLRSWMASLAEVDLRVGGKMRVNYDAAGTLGDDKTIENTILAYEPERMIGIKATKPPANFPFPTAIKDMWTVVYFQPVGADRTRVTIVSMGFRESEEAARMREFFDKGNSYTLEKLRDNFARNAGTNEADPLVILHRMVGGEWIFEDKREGGGVFRGRSIIEEGPDGKSLISKGWLGNAGGMSPHHAGQIWRDPESKAVRFQSLDEQGAVATGEIIASGENAVTWDWNMVARGGGHARYRVDMTFKDANHYEFVLHEVKADGTTPERVRVEYARVSEAPEEHRRLKAKTN